MAEPSRKEETFDPSQSSGCSTGKSRHGLYKANHGPDPPTEGPGAWAAILSVAAIGLSAYLKSRDSDFITNQEKVSAVYDFILGCSLTTFAHIFLLSKTLTERKRRRGMVIQFSVFFLWCVAAVVMTALRKDLYHGCPFRKDELSGIGLGVHCGKIVALHVVVWVEIVLQILAFLCQGGGQEASCTPPSDDATTNVAPANNTIQEGTRAVDLEMGMVPARTPGEV
ncbi:hypothetical protein CC2G_011211 [Coprinopsis cinerea AmutBmut pab1-1]|nr:hypothetical protein CC2G_011211 [Coprinopsis cinerea AmutBmut pab1-1]